MADITSECNIVEVAPNGGFKLIQVDTLATTDTGDTFTVTLANKGISVFMGITGCVHSTANSIIIAEAPTTAVSSGVLTVTVGGSAANNLIRSYLIWGK